MNGIISALITTRHYHFKVARLTEKHIYTVWNTRVNDMMVCTKKINNGSIMSE